MQKLHIPNKLYSFFKRHETFMSAINFTSGKKLASLLLLCLFSIAVNAQQKTKIILERSERSKIVTKTDITYLRKPVFRQDNAILTCDSAVFYTAKNYFEAYDNVHINQADTINIYSDRLTYDGNDRIAHLSSNVRMVDKTSTLTTNVLDYSMVPKVGTYVNGGKIVNKDAVITSKNGYYFANTRDAYFRYNVLVVTDQSTIKSDTLRYNTFANWAYFYGPTNIREKDGGNLYTENGAYNTKTTYAYFGKNNLYTSGSKSLKGDSLYYDGIAGYGKAVRNIVFKDTIDKMQMYGQLGYYYKKDQRTLVTRSAYVGMGTNDSIMVKEVKRPDSLWLGADTLETQMVLQKTLKLIKGPAIKKDNELGEEERDGKIGKKGKTGKAAAEAAIKKPGTPTAPGANKGVQAVPDDKKKPAGDAKNPLPGGKNPLGKDSLLKDNPVLKQADSLLKGKVPPATLRQVDSLAKKIDLKKADSVLKATAPQLTKSEIRKAAKLLKKAEALAKKEDREKAKNKTSVVVAQADSIARKIDLTKADSILKKAVPMLKTDSLKSKLPAALTAAAGKLDLTKSDLAKPGATVKTDPKAKVIAGVKKTVVKDTLPPNPADTVLTRSIKAYHHVKVFKSNMQATADSLFYTSADSTLRWYSNPIIWADGAQLTGDTIYVQLRNKKVNSVQVIHNSFAIKVEPDSVKFNQIKGKMITGFFKDGKLSSMYVDGNSESVYFTKTDDGKTYDKMNQTISSRIKIIFRNNEIGDVVPIKDVEGATTPVAEIKEEVILTGFIWKPELRPRSKRDITHPKPPAKKPKTPAVKNPKDKVADGKPTDKKIVPGAKTVLDTKLPATKPSVTKAIGAAIEGAVKTPSVAGAVKQLTKAADSLNIPAKVQEKLIDTVTKKLPVILQKADSLTKQPVLLKKQ